MSYEYADQDGDILSVEKGPRGHLIRAKEKFLGKTHMAAVYFAPEEAPALALAILEAAGLDNNKEDPEGVATAWLQVWRANRDEQGGTR